MISPKSIIAAVLMVTALGAGATVAQEHATPDVQKQPWSFAGVFGTFDEHQLQRGFQVFQEVCSQCHSAHLLAFRNLSEHGGPGFSEEQVKALAATFDIADPEAEGGTRKGIPADRWPNKFATEKDAREANGGALPPDMSVLAKARSITTPFPWWILNYFTAYQEGGPDYIYALLNGYHDEVPPTAPEGFVLPDGKAYNDIFPGHAIGMAKPIHDGDVKYADEAFPQTVDQYARDVSAFLMWVAEPHLVARKEAGFRVILFLILFAGLMWFVKEKLWAPVHKADHEPIESGKAH